MYNTSLYDTILLNNAHLIESIKLKTSNMGSIQDNAQAILELAKGYAADVDALTVKYGDDIDAIDKGISELVADRKETTEEFVQAVAERSKQFVSDVKTILDAPDTETPTPTEQKESTEKRGPNSPEPGQTKKEHADDLTKQSMRQQGTQSKQQKNK